ncbi:hypothetical protein CEXT_551541 [Caerostris extrusa]|uniref:Uncharacterized protein n=1 Tax=Caerostris extrusa TaxID=172846 RepID=A0AAV4SY42_CAEEX|nr:hypothetical protein CEXT_551541 [Caerostris extrusa]
MSDLLVSVDGIVFQQTNRKLEDCYKYGSTAKKHSNSNLPLLSDAIKTASHPPEKTSAMNKLSTETSLQFSEPSQPNNDNSKRRRTWTFVSQKITRDICTFLVFLEENSLHNLNSEKKN